MKSSSLLAIIPLLIIIALTSAQTSGDVSLPSNTFKIQNWIDVYYEFAPEGNITMALRLNAANEFFGFGWGTSMSGSDIWVFNIVNNEVQASDRTGVGHQEPLLDTALGGTDNLQVLGYELTSSYTLVKVTRALNTGDTFDAVIQPGPTDIIWATAVGSPTVTYHMDTKGTMNVDLVSTVSAAETQPAEDAEFALEEEMILEEEVANIEGEFSSLDFNEELSMTD